MAVKVGQILIDFKTNLATFESDMAKASKSVQKMGKDLTNVGKTLTAGITLPIVAVGAAVGKAAVDIDKGMDTIRAGTGATGKALEALGKDMRTVMGQVPQNVGQVSTAIADLNTRLGLTGKPLQEMTTQMLNLARLTGSEVGPIVASSTRLFGDWSVSTEKQSSVMDHLFKVSQNTGIGMQRLMDITVQYGAPLRSLGFDLESATVMMGKWEKEGVNMETVLAGLKIGLANFAKAGKDPSEALSVMVKAIQGAKTESEAFGLAIKTFGSRAGPDLARAIMEGRLSIDDLMKTVKGSGETINKAAADTLSFSEKMDILKNRVMLAAEPLGNALLKAFDAIVPYLEKAIKFIASLAEKFSALPSGIQLTVVAIAGIAAAIGPMVMALGMAVTGLSNLMAIGKTLTTVLGAGAGLAGIISTLGVVAAAIGAFWVGWKLGELLSKLEVVNAAGNKMADWILKIPGIAPNVNGAMSSMEQTTQKLADRLKSLGVDVTRMANEDLMAWNKRVVEASKAHQNLKPHVDALPGPIKNVGNAAAGAALEINENAKAIENLRKQTQAALNPMEELLVTIQKQINLGFSKTQIIKLHTDEIVKAALRQHELTGKISAASGAILAEAVAMQTAKDAASEAGIELIRLMKTVPELTLETYGLTTGQEYLNEAYKHSIDIMPKIEEGLKKIPEKNKEAGASMNELGRVVSTTLTNMTQEIAAKVTKWAGPFQSFAKAAMSSLLEGLFKPLLNTLTNVGNKIGNWLSGLLTGKGGGLGNLLGGGSGGGSWLSNLGGAFGLDKLFGGGATNVLQGPTMTGAPIGSGGFSMSSISSFLTNPYTIAALAAAGIGTIAYKLVTGKDAYEAAAPEAYRDFGVGMSEEQVKAWYDSMMLSENAAYGIRKDVFSSPAGLQMLGALAQQQGVYDEFLKRIENIGTSWGVFNFREEFEKGVETGVWKDLNDAFLKAWGPEHLEEINKRYSVWQGTLLAKDTATEEETKQADAAEEMGDTADDWSDVLGDEGGLSGAVPATSDLITSIDELVQMMKTRESQPASINVQISPAQVNLTIQGAGEDLVERVRTDVIPILIENMTGGPTGLRDAIVQAYNLTAGAYT